MQQNYTPSSPTRVITLGGVNYSIRVQGYKFLAVPPHENFVLKSFIEVLTATCAPRLLGSLAAIADPANENPDLRTLPVFVRVDAAEYYSKRLVYLEDLGFEQAKTDLANLSTYALADSINRHIVNCFEPEVILLLRMYDKVNSKWYTVLEIDAKPHFINGRPPNTYRWEGILFEQRTVLNENGVSHVIYTPSQVRLRGEK